MAEYVACSEGLVVEALDGGLVVYDTRCDQAHWLDRDAAAVWRACAQRSNEVRIARESGVEGVRCAQALERLCEVGVVEVVSGVSRRGALQAAARVGVAGAVSAPIISALIPVAAAHASTPRAPAAGRLLPRRSRPSSPLTGHTCSLPVRR